MYSKCVTGFFACMLGYSLAAPGFVPPDQVQVHWDPELRVSFSESNGVFTYTYGAFVRATDTFHLAELEVFPTAPLTWSEPYDPRHEWVGWRATLEAGGVETISPLDFGTEWQVGSCCKPYQPPIGCIDEHLPIVLCQGYVAAAKFPNPEQDSVCRSFPGSEDMLTFTTSRPPVIVAIEVRCDDDCFWEQRDVEAQQALNLDENDEYLSDDPGEQELHDRLDAVCHRVFWAIGPLPYRVASWSHWLRWLASLEKAKELGWFYDQQLYNAFEAKADAARERAAAGAWEEAKAILQELETMGRNAQDSQLHAHARALVVANAVALRQYSPATCAPALEAGPREQFPWVGESATVRGRLWNRPTGAPIVNVPVRLTIVRGVHSGFTAERRTNASGEVEFTIPPWQNPGDIANWLMETGRKPLVTLPEPQAETCGEPGVHLTEQGIVRWVRNVDGPDLAVTGLRLPFVFSAPGEQVFLDDVTANLGPQPAPPTITRYYISENEAINPASAQVLGQRQVPALGGGEVSASEQLGFTVPAGLRPGKLWLFACADADQNVKELSEENNCYRARSSFYGILVVPQLRLEDRLPLGVVGQPYQGAIIALGGTEPYQFEKVGGELPPGLLLESGGQVRGTPTQAGTFPFTAKARDLVGLEANGEFSIMVTQAQSEPIPMLFPGPKWVLIVGLGVAGLVALLWLARR